MLAIIGTIFSYAMNIPVFLQSFQKQNTSAPIKMEPRPQFILDGLIPFGTWLFFIHTSRIAKKSNIAETQTTHLG
ncbi:hypothetical protein WR25_23170 [Diploscapter pachys]|uniref:Uncharacterized protein n=1 Tax=Diploscapter pachys TaxID=2018661 RepID=A0A2A2LZV8_9BILA|nr:hypothetical protein WR25_23170 [Diploscapter pachys]